MTMSLQQTTSRLGQRDCKELLNIWLNFLPQIEFPTREEPVPTSEMPLLKEAKENIFRIDASTTTRDHHFVIQSLHSLIFLEAVYLFYKSLNVLKSSQCDALNGFKTWSVAAAYQASYFGLKCFLDILGVHVTRVANRDLIIDLYPSYRSLKKKEIERRRREFEVQIQLTKQLDHYEFWHIFQRVLRITQGLPLAGAEALIHFWGFIEPTEFARQRNQIIYYPELVA